MEEQTSEPISPPVLSVLLYGLFRGNREALLCPSADQGMVVNSLNLINPAVLIQVGCSLSGRFYWFAYCLEYSQGDLVT